MRRREVIALLGGAAVFPLAARAQQPERVRRIGVLLGSAGGITDAESTERIAAFRNGLQELGWKDSENLRIEFRRGAGNVAGIRQGAAELAALSPDVILSSGTVTLPVLLEATRHVPIVFVNVADPVGAGFVESLARPGGNATGFMQLEYSLSAKWVELLKQIAPGLKRVAVLRDPALTSGIGQFAVIQSVAPSLGLEVVPVNVREASEIERAVANFARSSNGGLIASASALDGSSSKSDNRSGGPTSATRCLLGTLVRYSWRPRLLWSKHCRSIRSGGPLRGPHFKRREAG